MQGRIVPWLLLCSFCVVLGVLNNRTSALLCSVANDELHGIVAAKHTLNNFYQAGCSMFETLSMGDLWRDKQGTILNSTYLPINIDSKPNKKTAAGTGNDIIIREKMMRWFQHLMDYYTPERLQRSLGNRPPSSSILKVLSIISDYPETKIPLKILVTGGSVTAGRGCMHNPVGWDAGVQETFPFSDCA